MKEEPEAPITIKTEGGGALEEGPQRPVKKLESFWRWREELRAKMSERKQEL